MESLGRETEKLLIRIAKAIEEQAEATKTLVEIAKADIERAELAEQEPGPSICPVCGTVNPVLHVSQEEGSGPVDQFVIVGTTECCKRNIYAVPIGFYLADSAEKATSIMKGEMT